MPITRRDVACLIEHCRLRPETTEDDVRRLCAEARTHGFHAACVPPVHVAVAAQELRGASSRVVTVVGFPHGTSQSEVKAFEARRAIRDGADELDMVVAIGLLKAGDHARVREDIASVVRAAEGRPVKVILETALLDEREIEVGCRLAIESRAQFVKTSTGFGPEGATLEAVRHIRSLVGERLGVKAAGGIRDARWAVELVEAGATRLGTSAGVELMLGLPE